MHSCCAVARKKINYLAAELSFPFISLISLMPSFKYSSCLANCNNVGLTDLKVEFLLCLIDVLTDGRT